MAPRRKAMRGFTLIELLIVIALIGILAVALLSAINPLEQMRKGRDSARRSDSTELLNAIERFYASFQCYPWEWDGADCTATPLGGPIAVNAASFGVAGDLEWLLTNNELKAEFERRDAVDDQLLCMTADATTDVVSVCFEPESQTGRSGGLGPTRNVTNDAVSTTCANAYAGGICSGGFADCWVCVPQ
ncbi:prepilin-type N-terminal cleavage/methylation domain-containing protein [Candidatus Microgenomates bacterium]|nr:prepilin-type N-terminal cleavage/methylation domain-containing protein [Candidatus Microgenomates bacterium]